MFNFARKFQKKQTQLILLLKTEKYAKKTCR